MEPWTLIGRKRIEGLLAGEPPEGRHIHIHVIGRAQAVHRTRAALFAKELKTRGLLPSGAAEPKAVSLSAQDRRDLERRGVDLGGVAHVMFIEL